MKDDELYEVIDNFAERISILEAHIETLRDMLEGHLAGCKCGEKKCQ
jgi:hypothetical protein